MSEEREGEARIAVIGMAGRFPEAWGIEGFWAACSEGAGCISRWHGREGGNRVPAAGLVAGQELFDFAAFGISPAEAEMLDPQHRVFLELCWEGLEQAAVVPGRSTPVAVYAAAAPSRYRPGGGEAESENLRYQRMIANGPDYLATRVSYHLDLCGEAVNVQTACSSSLVAVHLACLSLQSGRSDVALAGGVSIDPEQERGYAWEAGMIASPDGMCLPFDADARGAVPGNGAAVVVLQRLSDAIAQRRPIHAVILATAINNDGRSKSSFMAPNVEGQAEVIATAIATAGVPAETIRYVETHGTATRLGDSIEIEAARTAFRYFTDRRGFCAIGSLKANFGHLDRAAGAAGLIKAVLAVREGVIPPLRGFRSPNPDLRLEDSPFRIPTAAEAWPSDEPRRAGVSSFGVGGTNAHVIVEQFRAPDAAAPAAEPSRPVALPLSAHSGEALVAMGRNLAQAVDGAPVSLDVVHTLSAGRVARTARCVIVAPADSASRALADLPDAATTPPVAGPLAMLFPGQGAEIGFDAGALADRYPLFRDEVDAFAQALGVSSERLLSGVSGEQAKYREFAYQPALVAVQVALGRLAESLGASADALCGNSLGEFSAACMAGIFDRTSLMAVLSARDRAMRSAPPGRMLAVLASARHVEPLLLPDIDFAGENWSDRVLLSGPPEAISRQKAELEKKGILARILPGRVAPHGRLMTAAAAGFRKAFDGVRLGRASRPIVSTLTGTWADPDELADPEHWVRHLCEPFCFHRAFQTLVERRFGRFAEASPGAALTKLIHAAGSGVSATSLGGEPDSDPVTAFLTALGDLWKAGTPIEWDDANGSSGAAFVPLPPYPFQRQRFWTHRPANGLPGRNAEVAGALLERPAWVPQPVDWAVDARNLPRQVVIHGSGPLAGALADGLRDLGIGVARSDDPGLEPLPADAVLVDLGRAGANGPQPDLPIDAAALQAWLETGFLEPLKPLRQLRPARLLAVTRGLWAVVPGERASTACAGTVGIATCAPHDWPGMRAGIVDLPADQNLMDDLRAVIVELASPRDEVSASRGKVRYRRVYEAVEASGPGRLRPGGTYVVLGGTGRLGAVVAEAISREVAATIVLVGRNPDRDAGLEAGRLIAAAAERGCEILRLAAESDDREQLRGLLDELTARYARIDGIFHLAANTDTAGFPWLAETTPESAAAVAGAKVRTAALLAEELAGRDYDFVVLFSSISTVIGAVRFGSYVAANAYLDALAVTMAHASGRAWRSLIWDGWAPDGVGTANALGFDDGAMLLLEALRTDEPLVAAGVRPLDDRLASVRSDLMAVADAGRAAASATDERPVAEHILKVIADVTGHSGIDPKRNFASLGIDSLRLMQIAVRLLPRLGKAAGIGTLMAARSAEELVALAGHAADNPVPDSREAPVGEQDLSTPQERLWYLAQLDPGSSSYNVPFGWRVPPELSGGVRAALLSMLERHDMLRSAYRHDADGRPIRIVLPASAVPVEEVELESGDPESDFAAIARRFVHAPFDLEAGSARLLIASGRDGTRIVFVCHHISIDAWSIRLLAAELVQRLVEGEAALPALPADYRRFIQLEREMRNGEQYEGLARYWRETLRDLRPTLPPADGIAADEDDRAVGRAQAMLPPEGLAALRRVLREEGATLYAAGLTGLALALGQWCGESEVVLGTNLANRMREELEAVVGMFVDPIVLRLDPGLRDPAANVGSALARVRQSLASAVAHTGMPYLDVVGLTGHRDSGVENPLFSIIATMFDAEEGISRIEPLDIPLPATSKFALAVEFLPRRDGLMVHVLYAAGRYRPSTIERLLKRTVGYLECLAAGDLSRLLSELPREPDSPAPRERFAQRFGRLQRAPTGSPAEGGGGSGVG